MNYMGTTVGLLHISNDIIIHRPITKNDKIGLNVGLHFYAIFNGAIKYMIKK